MEKRGKGMDRLSTVYGNVYYYTGNKGYSAAQSHNAGVRNVVEEALEYIPTAIVMRNAPRILRACLTLQAKIEGWEVQA